MRLVAAFSLVLTACEARYGTYFTIDGDGNQIQFDRVELYFGTKTDRSALATPAGIANGSVFERNFDASDRFDVPKKRNGGYATESEYYLPSVAANKGLGYVAVTVYRDAELVGVGELLGFKVETDAVDRYDIELEPKPLLGLSVWGEPPGCFAWTRDRGGLSTIGVMSPNDFDCDGIAPTIDCNDFCPAGATQCDPNAAICGDTSACGVGCTAGGGCEIAQCLPTDVCGDACQQKGIRIEERMNCYADLPGNDHLELQLPMSPMQRPCTNALELDVPGGHFCTEPKILWFDKRKDDYKFDIEPSATNPSACLLSWMSPSNAIFAGEHHVLISFAGVLGRPRWSIMIGVAPGAFVQCATGGNVFGTSGSSPLYECQ